MNSKEEELDFAEDEELDLSEGGRRELGKRARREQSKLDPEMRELIEHAADGYAKKMREGEKIGLSTVLEDVMSSIMRRGKKENTFFSRFQTLQMDFTQGCSSWQSGNSISRSPE